MAYKGRYDKYRSNNQTNEWGELSDKERRHCGTKRKFTTKTGARESIYSLVRNNPLLKVKDYSIYKCRVCKYIHYGRKKKR